MAALFHAARGSDVVLSVVQGRVLYAGGELRSLDRAGLEAALTESAERVRAALA